MPLERTPARDGAMPILNNGEEIRHSEQGTKLYVGKTFEGEGSLHLSTQRIVWLSTQDGAKGIAMDYPFVTVHAVSRDTNAFPEPCLYCQLRTEDKGNDEEVEDDEVPELRFVPSDTSHLQQIFYTFSEMSALNPDPNDEQIEEESSSEGDDDGPALAVMWNPGENDAAMEDADEDDDDAMQDIK
mmetsp:Transcript_56061/g.133543  ORF Transcript_56061/g.133543 Transcript_56061/m.133543 type:complete len:185 (+) Transcript_56061:67-621(+)|eukprot:CAMPEP_0178419304 /NCGR_PEP_ID=MMETSP0689_2-20121128/25540_1 /TAXON_ID=160604 /ORGANISM="Amphidinium massartii, Strain CS-259" /LENGTH=184 /DNA_ID=CAMNT_0020040735 /DNA_START=29 /DNA_END=583 /DNA_ORIENTATION=-